MKRITKISIAIVGTLMVAGLFSACGHRGDPEHRAQWMMERVAKKLELDEAQQLQLKNVSSEMMTARKTMKQEFGGDREQFQAMLEQPVLDQELILSAIRTRTEAFNERAPVIVAALGEFYDGLSAEQQAQIRDFMQEHRERRGRWSE